jgi:hypothetical protein
MKVIGILLAVGSFALAQGPGPGGFGRAGGPGRGFGPGGERVVANAPFSATEVRTFQEQLADGNSINRTAQTVIYRDSQGRTRTEVTVTPPGKTAYTMITINDPVAGLRHELNSPAMTSRTTHIPQIRAGAPGRAGRGRGSAPQARNANSGATPAVHANPNGSQIARADLGSQVKNNILATGTRETEVIPARSHFGNTQPLTVTRETWYSSEIKRDVEVRVTDPQRGNSTTELTNLAPGEPSTSLFSIPAGYTDKVMGRGGRGPQMHRGGPPPAGPQQ